MSPDAALSLAMLALIGVLVAIFGALMRRRDDPVKLRLQAIREDPPIPVRQPCRRHVPPRDHWGAHLRRVCGVCGFSPVPWRDCCFSFGPDELHEQTCELYRAERPLSWRTGIFDGQGERL